LFAGFPHKQRIQGPIKQIIGVLLLVEEDGCRHSLSYSGVKKLGGQKSSASTKMSTHTPQTPHLQQQQQQPPVII